MKKFNFINPSGLRDLRGTILRRNTIASSAKVLILLTALAIFLPYQITSVVVACVGVAFCVLPGTRDKIFIHKGTFTIAIFTLITATVALCYGNYIGLLRTGVFAAMFVVFCVARALATRGFYEQLLNCICLGGSISTAGSIVERIIHHDNPYYRCRALFTNPNFFGAAIMLVILICAYKAVLREKNTVIYYLVAAFNAIGLYLCGSMALWGVLFIGVIILLLLNHEYRMLTIFFAISMAVLMVVILVPQIMPRLNELSTTTVNRVKIWGFSIEQIKESPIFGHGFFSYKFLYSTLSPSRPDIYKAALAHNILLDCMLSHGFVGSVLVGAYLTQFIKTVFECHDGLKSRGHSYIITTFIAAVGAAIACYGMIDTTMIWVQGGLILMFIASGIGVDERSLRHIDHAERARALLKNK